MSSDLAAFLTVAIPLILFLGWRIRIAKRINDDERSFIKEHIERYAILIFQGNHFKLDNNNSLQLESLEKIENLYGLYTYAIPEGEYSTIASFEFSYGNGSKSGARSSTPAIIKTLNLKNGLIYRYRLENAPIPKKYKYKNIFEEVVISRPRDVKIHFEHTVVFEEVGIN